MRRALTLALVVACGGTGATTTEPLPTTTTLATTTMATAAATTTTRAATTTTQATTTTVDYETARETFRQALINDLETNFEFERVDLVTMDDGILSIEGHTKWASQDNQASVSWDTINYIAEVLAGFDEVGATLLFAGTDPRVHIRTLSVDGEYPYSSMTPFALLAEIEARLLSLDGWIAAAGAGFE